MKIKTKFIAKVGVLSALATAIMFLETPLPFTPTFLKLDLSELIVLLGGFALGPLAGILIELIKNLVHVAFTITGGVGEFANFVVGCAFVVPAAIIYKKNKSVKNAVMGLIVGSLTMVIVATFVNYYVMIPLYVKIFAEQFNITPEQSLQGVVAEGTKNNSGIVDLKTLILFGIVPFNLFKVIVISILTFVSYKKVSPVLHK
ncbi:MAG: ECF transporter S component [Acetivibrionales bacterium]|jgi:riboflavin transporter FmnP|nr:ECF transporter S component [Clostridiaceae bacterium]